MGEHAAGPLTGLGSLLLDARTERQLLDLVRQEAARHRRDTSKDCLLRPDNACRFCRSLQAILGPCRCKTNDTRIVADCLVHGVTPGGSNV